MATKTPYRHGLPTGLPTRHWLTMEMPSRHCLVTGMPHRHRLLTMPPTRHRLATETPYTPTTDITANSTLIGDGNALSTPITDGTANSTRAGDGNARSTVFDDGNALSTPFTEETASSTLVGDGNARSTLFDHENTLSTPVTDRTTSSIPVGDGNARSKLFDDGNAVMIPFTDGTASSTLVNDENARSTLFGDGNALSTPLTDLSGPETAIHGLWLSYTVATSACLFLLVGLFGNGMTLTVTLKSETRFKPHNILIMSLAVADTLSLLTNTFNIRAFGELSLIDLTALKAASPFTCKLFNATYRMSLITSTLMIMLICIERFIVVWFPLKSRHFLTKRLTIVSVASCVMATVVIAAVPSVVYSNFIDGTCYFNYDVNGDGETDITQLMPLLLVQIVLFVITPMLIMLILTPLTIFKLHRQQAIRRSLTSQEPSTGPYRTSVLLTTVVVVYLSLVGIPHLLYTGMTMMGYKFATSAESWGVIVRLWFVSFAQANYSTNFILYTMVNKEFRQNFLCMLGCLCCRYQDM